MLTKDLIEQRMGFWGYGSFEAPTWFVGMEEGLAPEGVPYLEERFRATAGKDTIDMRRDMTKVPDHIRWFRPGASIQAHWKYPLALYLYLKNGYLPEKKEIRRCQTTVLGDSVAKETVAIELMPLPSQKADESTWLYEQFGIPDLASRARYIEAYKSKRVQELNQLIKTHQPRLVIFSSLGYLSDWAKIMGEIPKMITRQMYFIQKGETSFCVIPQGSAFGMSYDRIHEYAGIIRPMIR